MGLVLGALILCEAIPLQSHTFLALHASSSKNHQATEPQATEPQATEPQATEPQATEPPEHLDELGSAVCFHAHVLDKQADNVDVNTAEEVKHDRCVSLQKVQTISDTCESWKVILGSVPSDGRSYTSGSGKIDNNPDDGYLHPRHKVFSTKSLGPPATKKQLEEVKHSDIHEEFLRVMQEFKPKIANPPWINVYQSQTHGLLKFGAGNEWKLRVGRMFHELQKGVGRLIVANSIQDATIVVCKASALPSSHEIRADILKHDRHSVRYLEIGWRATFKTLSEEDQTDYKGADKAPSVPPEVYACDVCAGKSKVQGTCKEICDEIKKSKDVGKPEDVNAENLEFYGQRLAPIQYCERFHT